MDVKSKNRVLKVIGLSRTTVREWINIKDTLLNRKCPFSRRHQIRNDKNKKALYYDVELELHQWFLDQRLKDIVNTQLSVKNKMINLMKDKHPDESAVWKSSNGWLKNFMKCYDLLYRRITTSRRELPKDQIDRSGQFLYKFEYRCFLKNFFHY
jgi:hypothetical protein